MEASDYCYIINYWLNSVIIQATLVTEMLPRCQKSVEIPHSASKSNLEYVFLWMSFWKIWKNESFLITHFHCQNYLLRYVIILPWLLTRLSAFVLARKFLHIIILLKLAFSTTLFILFSYHIKLSKFLQVTKVYLYTVETQFLQIYDLLKFVDT